MILLIDNYDSFSYNLYQLIGELNPDIRVIRNDEMTVEEIRALLASGIPEKATALQAIGYKEFVDALAGRASLEAAAEQVKLSSRRYAKRQLTWFRRNPNMHWITRKDGENFEEILAQARRIAAQFDK